MCVCIANFQSVVTFRYNCIRNCINKTHNVYSTLCRTLHLRRKDEIKTKEFNRNFRTLQCDCVHWQGPVLNVKNFRGSTKEKCLDQLQDTLSRSYFLFYLTVLVLLQYVRPLLRHQTACNKRQQATMENETCYPIIVHRTLKRTTKHGGSSGKILSRIRSVQTAQQLYRLAALGDFVKSF